MKTIDVDVVEMRREQSLLNRGSITAPVEGLSSTVQR